MEIYNVALMYLGIIKARQDKVKERIVEAASDGNTSVMIDAILMSEETEKILVDKGYRVKPHINSEYYQVVYYTIFFGKEEAEKYLEK